MTDDAREVRSSSTDKWDHRVSFQAIQIARMLLAEHQAHFHFLVDLVIDPLRYADKLSVDQQLRLANAALTFLKEVNAVNNENLLDLAATAISAHGASERVQQDARVDPETLQRPTTI